MKTALHDAPTKGAKLYGEPGEQCHYPGCRVLLSAYNERDICLCHPQAGKKRKPRKRGESRSAHGEAVTNAAETPRRVTREELEMAAAKRQEMSEAKKAVLAALTDEYDAAPRIAERAGVKEALAYYHLKRLVDNGQAEHKLGKGGGYRARQDVAASPLARMAAAADAMTEEDRAHYRDDEDAPADPTGAAPATSPPQPAAPAAPSPHDAESPAAGTCDPEVDAISACVRALQPLGEIARRRVVCYLSSRESGAGQ